MLLKIIQGYYWSIFFFMILDYGFGINIRITGFIYHPTLKFLYYIFCISCLFLIYKFPSKSARIGLIESTTNIVILIFSIYLPMFSAADLVESGQLDRLGITTEKVINMVFAGTINAMAFYYNKSIVLSEANRRRSLFL